MIIENGILVDVLDDDIIATVRLPEGLEIIGREAFAGFESLTYVNVPDGVKSIERGAFSGCGSIGCESLVIEEMK